MKSALDKRRRAIVERHCKIFAGKCLSPCGPKRDPQ